MNFLARVITKRSIKEVLKVIETYFLGPTNDLIFGSISPLVLGGVGIPRLTLPSERKPTKNIVVFFVFEQTKTSAMARPGGCCCSRAPAGRTRPTTASVLYPIHIKRFRVKKIYKGTHAFKLDSNTHFDDDDVSS